MNNTILTLLMVCMYVTGNPTTNAMEKKSKEIYPEQPFLRTTTFERASVFQAAFYPDDEQDQRNLEAALFSEFDPEVAPDEAGELQVALIISQLEHYLMHDGKPLRDGEIRRAVSSSPQRLLPSNSASVLPKADVVYDMPDFNGRQDQLEPMIEPCARMYMNLLRELGVDNVTVDNLTDSFLEYSDSNGKGWPKASLQRIAAYLVNADSLHSPRELKEDLSSADSSKK